MDQQTERATVDTLIISDIHLGSGVSRSSDARILLKHMRFKRLILLGDIFCDLNFRRLRKTDWQFLSLIRKLSNPKRGVEVVWVEGNHDFGLSDVMSHLVGVRVYPEYSWSEGGLDFLAIHGHQFDRFLINNGVLSHIGEFIYLQMQKFDTRKNVISRWLDRLNSKWLRLTPKVCQGALAYARSRRSDVVFCGHTHQAYTAQQDGVRYFNTGCWTHESPTFVTISNGQVELHSFYLDPAVPTESRHEELDEDLIESEMEIA